MVNLPNGRSIDVADPRNRKTDEEDKANAALIASAPEVKAERDSLLLQVEEMKSDLKESNADADALILLSTGLYERIQGRPDWVVPSACQTALNYIDHMNRLVDDFVAVLENIASIPKLMDISPTGTKVEFMEAAARRMLKDYAANRQTKKPSAPVPVNEQCWCAAKAEAKDAKCPIHD